jgi:hypothetical protein
METEKGIEFKSTIAELRNIIKNQERVIEEMQFEMICSKEWIHACHMRRRIHADHYLLYRRRGH